MFILVGCLGLLFCEYRFLVLYLLFICMFEVGALLGLR